MKSSRLLDAVLYFGTRVFLQLFRIGESALAILVFGFEIGAYLGRRRDLHPLSCAGRALDPRLIANTQGGVLSLRQAREIDIFRP
jgi:hypothetical protein